MEKVANTLTKTRGATKKRVSNVQTAVRRSPAQPNTKVDKRIILKDLSVKPENHMTTFEKIRMIKDGISKKDLQNLKETIGLDYDQLAKTLSVARVTLINKKGAEKFNQSLSEKIVSLADLFSFGYEVFEDEKSFNEWLFRSNLSLGQQRPYDLLDSQYGREEIKNLIGRIEYGVFS